MTRMNWDKLAKQKQIERYGADYHAPEDYAETETPPAVEEAEPLNTTVRRRKARSGSRSTKPDVRRRTAPKKGFILCPKCDVEVLPKNLGKHIKRVHPLGERGVRPSPAKQKAAKRKGAARTGVKPAGARHRYELTAQEYRLVQAWRRLAVVDRPRAWSAIMRVLKKYQ